MVLDHLFEDLYLDGAFDHATFMNEFDLVPWHKIPHIKMIPERAEFDFELAMARKSQFFEWKVTAATIEAVVVACKKVNRWNFVKVSVPLLLAPLPLLPAPLLAPLPLLPAPLLAPLPLLAASLPGSLPLLPCLFFCSTQCMCPTYLLTRIATRILHCPIPLTLFLVNLPFSVCMFLSIH